MAEGREDTSRLYGPPTITIIPREGVEDGPPQLHASRIPSQARALCMIQPLESWYPPTRSAEIAPSSTVYDSQLVQRRWLFNAHPEAFVGSSEASGFLAEGLAQIMRPDDTPTPQPLLAISQMADVSNHTHVHPVPVLAMATGESGELLRLSRMDDTKWQWGEHDSPTLRLLNIDLHDKEETVLWSNDGAPILQIKPALSLVRFEPIRWILVQKRTSTIILQPEYHKVPVSDRPLGINKAIERPSRINPKPILTMTSEQTGGIAHSDVSFSHGSRRKPPQLAIIDECGYWSVWDIKNRDIVGSTGVRPKLRHCGHIELGFQEQLPDEDSPVFRPEPHGVLWIGSSGPGVDLWDASGLEDSDLVNDLAALTAPSKKLLLWNRTKFEVIDVKDPGYRKSLSILATDEQDHILDVKPNPVNRNQVFILTTSRVVWLEISAQDPTASKSSGLSVLQSCSHLRSLDNDCLRLTVHHGGHESISESCTVYIYSEKSPEVEVYRFSVPENMGLPQFQHHLMQIGDASMISHGRLSRIHTLCPVPAFFSSQPAVAAKGPGADYLDRKVRFHQLFILGRDLGLDQTLLAFSASRDLNIVPPDNNRTWSRDGRRQAHKRRRKQFLHHVESTFVVPDGLGDMDELVQRRANRYQELLQSTREEEGEQLQERWPRIQNLDLFMSRISVSIDSVIMAAEQPSIAGPLSIFDAIQEATINCLQTEGGYIPLHTLHEYEATFEAPPIGNEAVSAWDLCLQRLLDAEDPRVVAQPVTTQLLHIGNTATPLASIRDQLEEVWGTTGLPPRAQNSRNVILAETAEAIARTIFGVAVLDENLPIEDDESPSWVPVPPPEPIQQQQSSQRHSLSPIKRSRSLSPVKSTQPRYSQSPIKPRFQPRFSFSPIKPTSSSSARYSQSPAKPPLSSSSSSFPPSSSVPYSQSSAAATSSSNDATADSESWTALQRLSMLATDIDAASPLGGGRQHSVLSYWPAQRGVSTAGYVSSVLASSNKHLDAINARRQRAESRRRKRRSQLFGASSQTAPATQDEAEGTGGGGGIPPSTPAAAQPAATQPLPRLAPPVIGSSSQAPVPPAVASSQAYMSSQMTPQTMSQPMGGRHGMRSPKKKGKRKSGF